MRCYNSMKAGPVGLACSYPQGCGSKIVNASWWEIIGSSNNRSLNLIYDYIGDPTSFPYLELLYEYCIRWR